MLQVSKEAMKVPWAADTDKWKKRVDSARMKFIGDVKSLLAEYKEIIELAEVTEDVETQEELDQRQLAILKKKGKAMLEVGWPRVVSDYRLRVSMDPVSR